MGSKQWYVQAREGAKSFPQKLVPGNPPNGTFALDSVSGVQADLTGTEIQEPTIKLSRSRGRKLESERLKNVGFTLYPAEITTANDLVNQTATISLPSLAEGEDLIMAGEGGYHGRYVGASEYYGFDVPAGPTIINYNKGHDVLVGGWWNDEIKPLYDSINTNNPKNNKKLIVGGSGADKLTGSNGDDYLVGDRLFGGEGVFASRSFLPESGQENSKSIDRWEFNSEAGEYGERTITTRNAGIVLSNAEVSSFWAGLDSLAGTFGRHRDLISNNPVYGKSFRYLSKYYSDSPGYESYTHQAYTHGLGLAYITEVGKSNEYYNLWQPYGDEITGGSGNDVIYGDDSNSEWSRLIEYRLHSRQSNRLSTEDKKYYYGMSDSSAALGATGDKRLEVASNAANIFRLGNDYLDGGPGSDQIYGGFGKDLIIGGTGSDFIFAPTTILESNYGFVQGAPTLYGDQTYSQKETSPQSDDPDVFIIGAPVFTEDELRKRFPSNGSTPGQDYIDRLASINSALDKADSVVSTASDLLGLVPVVGDVISAGLSAVSSILNLFKSSETTPPKIKPNSDDYMVEIRDFGASDTLIVSTEAGYDLTAGFTDGLGVSIENTAGRERRIEKSDRMAKAAGQGTLIQSSVQGSLDKYNRVYLANFVFSDATNKIIESAKNIKVKNNPYGKSLGDILTDYKAQYAKDYQGWQDIGREVISKGNTKTYYYFHQFRSEECQQYLKSAGFSLSDLPRGAEITSDTEALQKELYGNYESWKKSPLSNSDNITMI